MAEGRARYRAFTKTDFLALSFLSSFWKTWGEMKKMRAIHNPAIKRCVLNSEYN